MHSHFMSHLGFYSTEEDQIHNDAILGVAYPLLSIPFRSQDISRHGIDPQSRNIPSLASEELTYYCLRIEYRYMNHTVIRNESFMNLLNGSSSVSAAH